MGSGITFTKEELSKIVEVANTVEFIKTAIQKVQTTLGGVEKKQILMESKLSIIEDHIKNIREDVTELQDKQEEDIKEIQSIQKQRTFMNFVRQNYRILMVAGMLVGGMVGGLTMVYEFLKTGKGL